ncbi:MAG: hypothetical protein NWF06_01420 [Candidatus Bathyarchaeota archaeon]|nr:hypothetical protein [Candidatus Bathyarchaeum sp.]
MKKRLALSSILIIILLLSTVFLLNYSNPEDTEPVYVGVTYCGDSVEDGKLLIDKIKEYTNLFVLQSGTLQRDFESIEELGDYAVSAGLYFLPYFGYYSEATFSVWLETVKQKWGTYFLGVYYCDEPGGKMLDGYVEFENETSGDTIMKTMYGDVVVEKTDDSVIHYELSGVIHLYLPKPIQTSNNTSNGTQSEVYATFYPDGTIEVDESNTTLANIQIASLPDYATYDKLLSLRPLNDTTQTANQFIARNKDNIEYLSNATTAFTSDYALYWFDYLSGYDVILTHIGWNHTINQHIALTRGAATLQNKDWGIVITWKYKQAPYLDSGQEIFNQMTTAYECGAKYFVIFNYYGTNNEPYGTMENEHFEAVESFWNDVVKNPDVVHDSIIADSVLVLPKNYGWGMRWQQDKIWGIFKPDDKSQQIWNLMETVLQIHDLKTDIIYDDANFPLAPQYQNIYYWNQTQDTSILGD